ncbi:MAG: hypothetical protein H6Q05_4590 [Acidobacteria bacterium]|nr:hypothetical protein [Acidobacteriota bacterium]
MIVMRTGTAVGTAWLLRRPGESTRAWRNAVTISGSFPPKLSRISTISPLSLTYAV